MEGVIQPFTPGVSAAAVRDFRERLRNARMPDPETVDDWSQGVPLLEAIRLRDALLDHDFGPCLERMGALGSCRASIEGHGIHLLIVPGPGDSLPLVMTHGWPGGVVEFFGVAEALTERHTLVMPSLPGFGYSEAPREPGMTLERIADLWAALMRQLGHDRYVAQGGDWGSEVSLLLAQRHPQSCLGAHINMVSARPPDAVRRDPTDAETAQLQRLRDWGRQEMGYFRQQASRPQTLGYGLADSPLAQACWIAEKVHAWTEHSDARPYGGVPEDRLLDLICLYWFTNSATSSSRLYWESGYGSGREIIDAPVACALFPSEINAPSRRWAASRFKTIVQWTEHDRGGHFPAMECPDLFVDDVIRGVDSICESR